MRHFLYKRVFYLLHIRKHFFFFAGVTEKKCRVINCRHKIVTLFKPFTVLFGDLEIGLYKTHSGNSSKANDNLGPYKSYLLTQIVDASVFLSGKGVSVFGWTALENVCYVDVLAAYIYGIEELVEKLTGSAYEGSAAEILLLTGGFANE